MKIQRYIIDASYEVTGRGKRSDTGDWVKWSDVQKLIALREAEAAEVEASRAAFVTSPAKYVRLADNPSHGLFGGQLTDEVLKARDTTNAARREANIEEQK